MEDFNEDDEVWSNPVTDTLKISNSEQVVRDKTKDRQPIHRRTIVHIDVDCFYAQVEMIRNPTLRDKPLGIQQKNIVVTCNYVARRYGVTKLMYIKDAKEKCPQMVLVSGEDLTNYRNMSYKISEFLLKYTPYVERLGMDENYLDVSELVECRKDKIPLMVAGHVFGESNQDSQEVVCTCGCYDRILIGSHIAEEIRAALHKEMGITCCAGIAHNKLLSKLVGEQHKPNQQTTLFSHHAPTFMSKLPKARSIPGIGSATARRLAEFGVVTMTDLQQCPLEDLKRELGDSAAVTIKELSEGIDENPVIPYSKPQTLSDEDSFKSCCSVKEANQKIKELVKSLMIRLVEDGRIAGTVRLTIRRLSAENKYLNRESKQCNIPSHVSSKLSKDNQEQACDKMEDLVMSLFNKLVDVKKPFHLTLMNVAFCNLTERNKNSISHFFSPQKNRSARTDNKHSNADHSNTYQTSELYFGNNDMNSSAVKEAKMKCSTSMSLPISSSNHYGNNSEEYKEQSMCESETNLDQVTVVPVKQSCGKDNARHLVNKRKSSSPKSGFFSKRIRTKEKSSECKSSCDLTSVSQDSIDAEVFSQLPPEIQKEITESRNVQQPPSPVFVKQTLGSPIQRGEVDETYTESVQNEKEMEKDSSNAELTADLTCKSDSKNLKSFTSVTNTDKTTLVPAGYDRDVFLNLPPDIQRELVQEEERKAEWAYVKHGRQGVRNPQNRDSKSANAGNLLKYLKRSK